MNRNRTIIFFTLLLYAGVILGQENFQSTVTVTKEFESKLGKVHKSKFAISYPDSLLKFKLNFDYSAFDRPYKDLYEFSPLNGVRLQTKGETLYPFFLFRGALSFPLSPEGDIYLQPRIGGRSSLVVYSNHSSFWGNGGAMRPVNRSATNVGLYYGYNWRGGKIGVGTFFNHDMGQFNLAIDSKERNIVKKAGAVLSGKSSNLEKNSLFYSFEGRYNYSESIFSIKEHLINGTISLGFPIKNVHRVGIDIRSSVSRFGSGMSSSLPMQTSGVLSFLPHYKLSLSRLDLVAGVGYAGVFGDNAQWNDPSKVAFLYPYVDLSLEAIKGCLWLKGKIDGDNHLYSFFELSKLNRWLTTVDVVNYSSPIRAQVGVDGSINDIFGYSINGGYSYYNKYLSFICMDGTTTSIHTYSNLSQWYGTLEISAKTKSIDGYIKGLYRDFDTKVYMVPNVEVEGRFQYNYMERIYAQVAAKYFSQMEGYGAHYGGFVDLGVEISYRFNPKFTIFIKGANLLNNEIFYIQDYIEPGVNFGAGICLKF